MRTRLWTRVVVAGALVAAGSVAGAGTAAGGEGGSAELHRQMITSANETRQLPMTGDVDHDFVLAMSKHHEDGIELARIALENAKDPQARRFARRVVDQQTREKKELDAWLAKHGAPEDGAGRQGSPE